MDWARWEVCRGQRGQPTTKECCEQTCGSPSVLFRESAGAPIPPSSRRQRFEQERKGLQNTISAEKLAKEQALARVAQLELATQFLAPSLQTIQRRLHTVKAQHRVSRRPQRRERLPDALAA